MLVSLNNSSLPFRGKTTNDRAQVDANYQMWGASQDILRKIEIPIVSGKNCRNEYGIFRKDTLLCAGAEEGISNN